MGERISIWDDLWISGDEADRLQNEDNNENIKLVSNLIEVTNRTWKTDIIVNTFTADIAKKIMRIPLAKTIHDDFQVWRGEPFGNFSVRSVYKLLQCSSMDPTSYLLQTETTNFYKKLWGLQLPSKITIIIWRISWDFIHHLANLRYRRVSASDRCPRCRY